MQSTHVTDASHISTKELRDQLASVVDRVALRGESFVITKFGLPRAVIMPVLEEGDSTREHADQVLRKSFGAWKNRPDAAILTRQIRRKAERRDEAVSR